MYGTVFFVEELIKRLASVTRELKTLQAQPVAAPTAPAAPAAAPAASSFPTLDAAPKEAPHTALVQWFAQKNIQAAIDPSAADTSGFFDEAATALQGHGFKVRRLVSGFEEWQAAGLDIEGREPR